MSLRLLTYRKELVMKLTKEDLVTKVNGNKVSWFIDLDNGELEEEVENRYKRFSSNDGDGREARARFEFYDLDMIVMMLGTYSSWGSTEYETISFVEPYTIQQTAYRNITIT